MERIKLNLIPSGVAPIVHLSQYDDGRQFGIDLFEGESVYVLDGTETLTVNSRKPDGHVVTLTVTNTGTSSLDVDTIEQLTAVHGVSYAKLKIEKGSVTIATLPFLIDVSRDPLENGDPSESFIQNLETQVSGMVAEDVATQYDSGNVIFDNEPIDTHGIGYTVTSEGIKTAIDNAFDYDNTASGSIVHIEDGADNIPVKSLTSEIEATQSGSGTPSPSNPRAISGFNSGIITRCGKNLFDTSKIRNGYFLTDGFHDYADWKGICIPVKSGETYIISGMVNQAGGVRYAFIKDRNNLYSEFQLSWGSTTINGYFTVPEGFNGFWIPIGTPNLSANIQVEKGSTATTYEAYNGNTYTFAFGQTVYGGHFDNNGNFVVTHKIVDFGNLGYYYSNGRFSSTDIPDVKNVSVWNSALKLCSCYDITEVQTWTQGDFIIGLYGKNIYVKDSRYTDTVSFKQALTGQKFIVELANPIVLSITSQDIPTLLGENNIFSNCGDLEVTYYTSKSNDILEFVDSEIGKKNGDNIPIEEGSPDSIKTYIDNEVSTINTSLADKANTSDIPFIKYEEINVTFDASGEGTLFNSVKFVVGLKDIPSDQLYVGYVSYIAGSTIKIKALSRTAIAFSSQNNVSSTRKVGVYYLDNIATQ